MKNTVKLSLLILLMICSGCATSQQARNVKTSGFLGDYGGFLKGGGKDPLLIYHGTDSLAGYHSTRKAESDWELRWMPGSEQRFSGESLIHGTM